MAEQEIAEQVIANRKYIGPNKTGDNIDADRQAVYGYDSAGAVWRRLAVDSSGNVILSATPGSVNITTPTQFQSYQVDIPITAVQIDVSALTGRKSVTVKANGANTQNVYIGKNSSVTSTNGFELAANEFVTMDITEAAKIYGISASGTQRVSVAEVA